MATSKVIPGPAALPFLGPSGSMLRFYRDPVRCMLDLQANHGSFAAVTRGDPSLVCAFGPEFNRRVLSDPDSFENAVELPVRIPPGTALQRLTTFLVGLNGDEHRNLRRTMLPLFQRSNLEQYRQGVIEATDTQLSTWTGDEDFDLAAATAEVALAIAFRCLFGLRVEGEATKSAVKLALGFISGATSMKNVLFPFDLPGAPYRRFRRLSEDLESRLLALLAERRAMPSEPSDVLSVLLALRDDGGRPLPDPVIVGLANELLIAGHETTACTLAWTLLLLDLHPRILDDLTDELSSVLGGAIPTLDDFQRLPLLDAVIKESMRLVPATPYLFFRKLTSEGRLGDYELPRGAKVIISPLMTHHMPDIYSEPRKFRPERWTGTPPSTYEYLPFGAGPRMCLGSSFANMSLRVVLSMVLQRHRVTLLPDARVSFKARGVILGTQAGMRARIQEVGAPRARRTPSLPKGNLHQLIELS